MRKFTKTKTKRVLAHSHLNDEEREDKEIETLRQRIQDEAPAHGTQTAR